MTGYTYPATWLSNPIDTRALGADGGTFHILWRDCTVTFYLLGATVPALAAAPLSHDWTAEYRAIDPAWVDPVLGDPISQHPVRWKNLGLRYVAIGWTASNWTGANRYLRVLFERDRSFR